MFSQVSVCPRGVSAPLHAGILPREHTSPPGPEADTAPLQSRHPHPQCMLGDTGNLNCTIWAQNKIVQIKVWFTEGKMADMDVKTMSIVSMNGSNSVVDPEFPRCWGANPPAGRGTNIRFSQIFPKLHEIERIWTLKGGVRPKFYFVDPSLQLVDWDAVDASTILFFILIRF